MESSNGTKAVSGQTSATHLNPEAPVFVPSYGLTDAPGQPADTLLNREARLFDPTSQAYQAQQSLPQMMPHVIRLPNEQCFYAVLDWLVDPNRDLIMVPYQQYWIGYDVYLPSAAFGGAQPLIGLEQWHELIPFLP